MTMQRRFADKTVVVTGASSGIGASAAGLFAQEGARVVLAARRREALETVASSLPSGQACVVPTDVTDPAACERLLDEACARFGGIDVLVNNAGFNARGPIEKRSIEELMEIIDVSLRATVVLCRLVLPHMRRAGRGSIVNVASMAGRVPIAGVATYSGTKAGLRVFSLALAEELKGSGITVSLVSPGPVNTDLFFRDFDLAPDLYFLPPMSEPDDVARLILDSAHDGLPERTIPRMSGVMTAIGNALPGVRRAFAPALESIGRHNKEELRRKCRPPGA